MDDPPVHGVGGAGAGRLWWGLGRPLVQITGKLTRANGSWTLRDAATGRTFTLAGGDFPPRSEGVQVRVVGVVEDSFGLGVLHDEPVLRVQQWRGI